MVILYDSKLLRRLKKFKTHWLGPFEVMYVTEGGASQLKTLHGEWRDDLVSRRAITQGVFKYASASQLSIESVLFVLIVQCSSHTLQANFLLFSLKMLYSINFINWDSFLSSLLSSVSMEENSSAQSSQAHTGMPSVGSVVTGNMMPVMSMPNSSIAQISNLAFPMTSLHIIGSPPHAVTDPASSVNQPLVKGSNPSYNGPHIPSKGTGFLKEVTGNKGFLKTVFLVASQAFTTVFSHRKLYFRWLTSSNFRSQAFESADKAESTIFAQIRILFIQILQGLFLMQEIN